MTRFDRNKFGRLIRYTQNQNAMPSREHRVLGDLGIVHASWFFRHQSDIALGAHDRTNCGVVVRDPWQFINDDEVVTCLRETWSKDSQRYEVIVHLIITMLLHVKYPGYPKNRPNHTWTSYLLSQYLRPLLPKGLHSITSILNALVGDGIVTFHKNEKKWGSYREGWYTVNLDSPAIIKGEVALLQRVQADEAAARLRREEKAKEKKPRSKRGRTKECPSCFGDGEERRSDDSSRHAPDDCLTCKGTGKVAA